MGSRGARVALLLAGVFLAGAAAGASRVALARLVRVEFGASMVVVASLTTWFMAARAVASLLGGVWSQSSGRVWRLLVGPPLLVLALIVWLLAHADSPLLVLALNAVWGFLAGLVWPQAQGLASILAPGGRSASMVSLYFAVGGLGISGGQYLYGLLPLGDRGVILASSLLYLASGVLLALSAWGVPHPGGRGRRGFSGLLRALRMGGLAAWILLVAFAVGYSSGILREFLYVYLEEAYGLSRAELGGVLGTAGLLALAVSLASGALADRLGTGRVLLALLGLAAAGQLLLALPGGVGVALAGLVLAQAGGRSSLPLTRNAMVFPGEARLALLGASNTASSLGMMTGPVVAGLVYEYLGGGWAFASAALVLGVAAVLYPVVARG